MAQDRVPPETLDTHGCESYKPHPDLASSTVVHNDVLRWAYMSERFASWQLDALIAVGGLGEIWRASRENHPEEMSALKRIHTHLVRNDEARSQFAREQDLAMTLPRHPNVVAGIEADAIEGRPYIALELVPGEDLRRTLTPAPSPTGAPLSRAPLSRDHSVSIILAACDAASHLHANGWIHGDINPSNLVSDGDRVVLIDLGIARAIGESGTPRGTHAYMAPEQVRGEVWTPATDVFALGVVLWELIAGARLFHRGPTWLSMQAVIEHVPAALPDRELDAIARAALAKNAADRIATPHELAERLRAMGN
jgi:serine/threonine protein kinase